MSSNEIKRRNQIGKRSLSCSKMIRNSISSGHNQIEINRDKQALDLKNRISKLKISKQVSSKKSIQGKQNQKIKRSLSDAFLPIIKKTKINCSFKNSLESKQSKPIINLIQNFKNSIVKNLQQNTFKKNREMKKLQIIRLDQKETQTHKKIIKSARFKTNENENLYQIETKSKRRIKILSKESVKKQRNLDKSKEKLEKIYNKIGKDYNRQQKLWYHHLQQQLSLEEAVEELQKIELNRNLQPSRKLTMRQAYQLKKQIVYEIEKEQSSDLIKANIQKLAQIALDQKQKDKFLMIGLFITLREKLRNPFRLKSEKPHFQDFQNQTQFFFSNRVIRQLNEEVSKWKSYKLLQANIINTKILSILVLHIMKIQSPIFSHQDIKLINKTIQLKIKVRSLIEYLPEDHKNQHFQALIYMIFQSYKILYYLKLDQDIKIHHYHLLQAYLSLYQEKNPSRFRLFQHSYGILHAISKMKPSEIGIYPYLDSRGRTQIKSLVLQKQIHDLTEKQANVLGNGRPKLANKNKSFSKIQRQQQKNYNKNVSSESSNSSSSDSKSKIASKKQISSRSIQKKTQNKSKNLFGEDKNIIKSTKNLLSQEMKNKYKINVKLQVNRLSKKTTQKSLRLSVSKKSKIQQIFESHQQNLSKIDKSFNINTFTFQFLLFKEEQIYLGQFIIKVSPFQPKTLSMLIQVKNSQGFYVLIYKFDDIRTFTQELNRQNFEKIIWKIFRKIFVMKYMQELNPFLMKQYNIDLDHVQNYLPDNISHQKYRIIQTVHQQIVYWLKAKQFAYTFNGKILIKPYFNLLEVNKYMENLQYQHDRKLFQKRQGYLDPSSTKKNQLNLLSNNRKKLIYSPILNDFIISQQKQQQSPKQLNIFLLTKVTQQDKNQFKFLHLLFYNNLREMNIFQIGFFKHLNTRLINEKAYQIRKLKIQDSQSKQKLIQNILRILDFQNEIFRKMMQNKNQLNFILDNKKYHIEQLFQLDLTNQFKFIPLINIKLVHQINFRNERQQSIRNSNIVSGLNSNSIDKNRNLVLRNMIFGFGKKIKNRRQQNNFQKLYSFKISNQILATQECKYSWGKKLLSLHKNLQFFSLNKKQQKLMYYFNRVSLYNVGIVTDKKILKVQQNKKIYSYYLVKKPFLSKMQNQNLYFKNNGLKVRNNDSQNNKQDETTQKCLHFIESKIFFTLKSQKIQKFKINHKIQYFSFQIYHPISCKIDNKDEDCQTVKNLFIYQLINLKFPQIKFYLLTEKEMEQNDQQKLQNFINFEEMSLMGEKMQQFSLSFNQITFKNEYNQLKVKNVRKNVISDANQYFVEKVLKSNQGRGIQDVFLKIVQKYKISENQDDHNLFIPKDYKVSSLNDQV